jgi:hypothetical protein
MTTDRQLLRDDDRRAIADSIAHDAEQVAELESIRDQLHLTGAGLRSVTQQVDALNEKIRREIEIEHALVLDDEAATATARPN